MQSIVAKEQEGKNSLFSDWSQRGLHKNKLFITDGIIDIDKWDLSKVKILFLLKEAYDSKRTKGTWPLPQLINKRKASGRTFKPLGQWAYGIEKVY